jgi:hypothetical protein
VAAGGALAYFDYLRANPAHVRLADEIKLHEPRLYRRAVSRWVERIAARIRAGIAQGSLRPMGEAEIAAQAHFLLGTRHFPEQMIEDADAPGDEIVVDAYLALVRDGLARRARRPSPSSARPATTTTRAGPTRAADRALS